jgi:hypothetical protein
MDLKAVSVGELSSLEQAYIWFDSPIPVKTLHPWTFIKEIAIPLTHMMIADYLALFYPNGAQYSRLFI